MTPKSDNGKYKEELIKRTYIFSRLIIRILRRNSSSDYIFITIGKQLIRSATSIGANVVEAQGSSSRKDFCNFIYYALKSANETRYWLGLLRDEFKVNKEEISAALKEAQELSKILGSTVKSLRK